MDVRSYTGGQLEDGGQKEGRQCLAPNKSRPKRLRMWKRKRLRRMKKRRG